MKQLVLVTCTCNTHWQIFCRHYICELISFNIRLIIGVAKPRLWSVSVTRVQHVFIVCGALSLVLGLSAQLWHSPLALWPYVHMVGEWWKSCPFSYSSLTYWAMERCSWSACGQRQWHTDSLSLSLIHMRTQLLVSSTDEFWENKQLQEEERTIRLDCLPNFIIYYGLPEMHTLLQPGACLRFTCTNKFLCTLMHTHMCNLRSALVVHVKPLKSI